MEENSDRNDEPEDNACGVPGGPSLMDNSGLKTGQGNPATKMPAPVGAQTGEQASGSGKNPVKDAKSGEGTHRPRGHPPYVAICEAVRKAEARKMITLVLEPGQDIPVHFILCDGPCVSFVRVRRLKYARFAVPEIEFSCRNDIAELRAIAVTQAQ